MLPLIPLVISLAPEIAKWLFGDTASTATTAVVQAVQTVTGVADVTSVEGIAVASAALSGKPELAMQLRAQLAQIAADHEAADRKMQTETLAAQLADVSNARAQTVALAQTKSAIAYAPGIVSGVVLMTFGIVMFLAITRSLPAGSETILNMLLGTLAAMATSVVSYWVGSSAGSEKKTDLLYRSVPPPT